jgi:hypothetical protein
MMPTGIYCLRFWEAAGKSPQAPRQQDARRLWTRLAHHSC